MKHDERLGLRICIPCLLKKPLKADYKNIIYRPMCWKCQLCQEDVSLDFTHLILLKTEDERYLAIKGMNDAQNRNRILAAKRGSQTEAQKVTESEK